MSCDLIHALFDSNAISILEEFICTVSLIKEVSGESLFVTASIHYI